MIQTVEGKISKIAPYIESTNKAEADKIAWDTWQFCVTRLGKPSERRNGRYIWDAMNGNAILEMAQFPEKLAINFFLTSNSVKKFDRI
jgi:hypothetical protein